MVKVYAVSLVVGVLGILWVVLAGALAENLDRPDRDPGARWGATGRIVIAVLTGFGMGGLSAEFAPLGFSWQVSLLLAIAAAVASGFWARFSVPNPKASA
jgi:hypothetical protein